MDNCNNQSRQAEEIEALCAIYDAQWQTEDGPNQSYSVAVSEGGHDVVLHIKLPPEYPGDAPPLYQISAPSLSRTDKQNISARLENVYLENVGDCVIYQWVEAVREFLHENNTKNQYNIVDSELRIPCSEISIGINKEPIKIKAQIQILHGEVIIDRKSIFQGHAAVITSVDQVKQVLSMLLDNKKIAQAKHNIYAYRVVKDGLPGCMVQDCEDDGENAAGGRLLHLLQVMRAINVIVVVTRWYGGIHIGPDRFRHINNAARQVLEQCGITNKK